MEIGKVRLFGVVPLRPILAWLGAFVAALLIALWMARPPEDLWPRTLWLKESDALVSNMRFHDSPGGVIIPADMRSMSTSASKRDGVLEDYELSVGVSTPGGGGIFSFGPEAWYQTTGQRVEGQKETWLKLERQDRD